MWRKEKHFRLVGGHSGVKEPGVSGQCQIVPGGLSPRPHKQAYRGRHSWKGGWLWPGRAVSTSLRKLAFILQLVMGATNNIRTEG